MDEAPVFTTRSRLTDEWDVPMRRLNSKAKLLFNPSEKLDVRLIRLGDGTQLEDFEESPGSYQTDHAVLLLRDEQELDEQLSKTSHDHFRILSFCQQFSLSPLLCSKGAMLMVMERWQISSMFIDVLLKFGDQPHVFQESSGFRQSYQEADGSFELCYQFMYIEPNGRRAPKDPWSFRQTGVYHKSSMANNVNKVLLLHPTDESAAETRIERLASSSQQAVLTRHPLHIHLLILSSYLCHWQDYIESKADELEQIRRYIGAVDPTHSSSVAVINAEQSQKLRHLEDNITCKASRCLKSIKSLVETLIAINQALSASGASSAEDTYCVEQELKLIEHRLEGHTNAAEILTLRVRATLGLLTNLLDIGNQFNSRRISGQILELTHESVEDNATVKVITVFTLIYLPASFMASVLGMNLFNFREDDGSFQASPKFWIYIVTTVPLTLLTVGGWHLFKKRQDRLKKAGRMQKSAC